MKINAFNMLTFGPFTDKRLDFSQIENGLHLVYGDNEAGKSTSLRALIALLFGFEHIVQDDWRHPTNKLAVSGELALDNGDSLRFTRYKRRKNDLINDDTGQPLDQNVLIQFLAGKTKNDFKNAYGISHDSLRQGVESVLASGGELGQTLFTATSGLSMLKDIMAELIEKQSGLFAPRARKAAINAGISSLREQRKKIRQVSTNHTQWKKKKKELDQLEEKRQLVEGRLSDLSKTIGTYTRYRDALKHVTRLDQVEQDLASLDSVPELPDDFPQRRIQAQAAIKESQQAQQNLQSDMKLIGERLQSLPFDDTIVASQELIESIASEIKVHIKEVDDSKNLRAKIHQAKRDADASLKLLGQNLSVDTVASLRLSKPAENKLRKLVSQHDKLEQSAETTDKELRTVKAKLKKLQERLLQLGAPMATGELQGCLNRIAEQGNLELRLSEVGSKTNLIQKRIEKDLLALGLWSGDLEAFEQLALPTEESIRQYADRIGKLHEGITELDKEIHRTHLAIHNNQDDLDKTTQNKELPNPEDLQTQRNLRDQGWRSVRLVWLEGGNPDQGFLSHFREQTSLADAYEQSVYKADSTVDILRTEAEAVAMAQSLRTRIDDLKNTLQTLEQKHDALAKKHDNTLDQWQALWKPVGISPLTPAEMIEWSGRVVQLRRSAAEYREEVSKKEQLENVLNGINKDLMAAFGRLDRKVPEDIRHTGLVELARRTIKENDELVEQRKELDVRLQGFSDQKDQIVQQIDDITDAKRQWSEQWDSAMLPLNLNAETKPDEAMDFIDALDAVFEKLDEIKANQQRIDAMNRSLKGFSERVQDAVTQLAPQMGDLEPDKAAAELKKILNEHLERRQEYKLLEEEKRKKIDQAAKEKEKLAGNQEFIHQLCAEASTSDPEQLPEVERQSRQKSTILKDEAAVKERLSELAAGQPLGAFVENVRQQDPDVLSADLEKAEAEKADLKKSRENLVADIAVAQNELNQFNGQSQAAGLAVEADGLAGKIQSNVVHYAKLHLASAILAKAIERYRKHNESPVLEAASDYFRILTGDSFSGLRADFDDKGDSVLKAVRAADKAPLTIDALSDGARDQMFLALRLGGLSRHIENTGSMPFIVDDVLVHFDNERSTAALKAMAGLAEGTQIIFFTHHMHLMEIAKRSLPEQILRLYNLSSKPTFF